MKIAIVLFNSGEPDSLENLQEFLFNRFFDPAIIEIPNIMGARFFLAKVLAFKQNKIAKKIYSQNENVLLEQTKIQAEKLEEVLNQENKDEYKTFIAMRYAKPFAFEAMADVRKFAPQKIILLPLYPQLSRTTTGSSIKDFLRVVKRFNGEIKIITDYFNNRKFINAWVEKLAPVYEEAVKNKIAPRILFSANGVTEKVALQGDPYPKQIEETAKQVVDELQKKFGGKIDYVISYQNNPGKIKNIQPETENEIKRAANEGAPVIIVPVNSVAESAETKVKLDKQYKQLAQENWNGGEFKFYRVPALSDSPLFIDALASLVKNAN